MLDQNKKNKLTVWEHINELRSRIIISFFVILAGAIFSNFYYKEIIIFLLKPIEGSNLVFLSPLEPILFIMKIDFVAGFIITLPILSGIFFLYIKPVMQKTSWSIFLFIYVLSTALIAMGLLYAFLVIFPISIQFLLSIEIPGVENIITAKSYMDFLLTQLLISSLIFQIPLITVGGSYLGVINTDTISSKRRYIYLSLLIFTSIITPTTDLFNLGIMFLPTIILFEVSLIISRTIQRIRVS